MESGAYICNISQDGSNDMRISARNVLKGRMREAAIINAAVPELNAAGKNFYAVIKVCDVMFGIS